MTSVLRFLFVTGCMVQILVVSSAFATADRKPRAGVTGHCFRQRTPIGQRGRCTDEIHPSVKTTLSGAKDCCSLGGVGWSIKTNGKRCENACKSDPDKKDVQSLGTSVTHKDQTEFQNDSNNTAKIIWSEWGDWKNCTASCGVGNNMTRYRTCLGIDHCNGSNEETIPCNSTLSCQDIGNATWSAWGDWQANCTASCGVGNMTRYRYRTCIARGHCNGSSEETIPCNNTINCQVDGKWTTWSEWSDCDPCDSNAKTTRSRSCTNPPPSGGGRNCAGLQSMTRNCQGNCPDQNNGWSEWSNWTPCSGECGAQGFSLRSRSCNGPQQTCQGLYLDVKTCTTNCTGSR